MPRVFLSNLDLGPVLEAVRRNGAAVVAEALADPFRRRLERELMTVPYEAAPAEVGPVRQETDVFVLRNLEGFPILAELAGEFRAAVRAHAREIRGLATYAPNEIHLQRYCPGSLASPPISTGSAIGASLLSSPCAARRASPCSASVRARRSRASRSDREAWRCSGLLAWEASATADRSMRSCRWEAKSACRSRCA